MLLAAVLALALVIPPAPSARVNDYAGVLKADEARHLETVLDDRERATGAQMVIAIFPSLEGESLEDFGIRLAERWRVGQKALDNGVILLVFVKEHRVRLEVGYGLEPVLPDAVAGQIIRDTITPRFREGKYAAGLEAATLAVFERVGPADASGKRTARSAPRRSSGPSLWTVVSVLVLVVVVLFQEVFSGRRFVGRNRYTAGRRGWSSPAIYPWWGGFFGGGGSGGGGGGGGGGFSGGGGSFGGGGASGDW